MSSEIDSARLPVKIVDSLFQTERYNEVLKEAERQKKRYPKNAFPYFIAGKTYARLGNRKMAENQLRKAVRINPSLWVAYRELGFLLIVSGRITACMRLIERLHRNVNVFESEKLCVLLTALIAANRGQISQAQEELRANLIYCWNDPTALEILRTLNPIVDERSLCWSLEIQGSLQLGSLITLPENSVYRFNALAFTQDECLSYIEKDLRFCNPTLVNISNAPNKYWPNDRHGIYQMGLCN